LARDFFFSTASRLSLGTIQPNAQWVLVEKWLGHEAEHSPPPTSTSASPLPHLYAFMACRNVFVPV